MVCATDFLDFEQYNRRDTCNYWPFGRKLNGACLQVVVVVNAISKRALANTMRPKSSKMSTILGIKNHFGESFKESTARESIDPTWYILVTSAGMYWQQSRYFICIKRTIQLRFRKSFVNNHEKEGSNMSISIGVSYLSMNSFYCNLDIMD